MRSMIEQRVHLDEKHCLSVASAPLCSEDQSPLVWLVGAHGGAGVTSLATSLAPMGDAGQVWPTKDKYRSCVLVGRTTREGLERLHDAALQARAGLAGDIELLGALLVSDAPGKLPGSLRKKLYAVESVVPRIWMVGFFPPWREILIDDLAEWSPLDPPRPKEKKRLFRRRPVATSTSPPPELIEVATEIVEIAFRKAQRKEPR